MNTYKSLLPLDKDAKLRAYDRWYRVFDDCSLRLDSHDAYYDELLRQEDDIDRLGVVTWQAWRELRIKADHSYMRAVAGADYR